MKLIAKRPILFESKQYAAGDELPTKDTQMVNAWIEGGSAVAEDVTVNGSSVTAKDTTAKGKGAKK